MAMTGKRKQNADEQLDVQPGLTVEIIRPVDFTTVHVVAALVDRRHCSAEEPVRYREEQTEYPDGDADGKTDLDLAVLPHRVVGSKETVDAQRHQREQAGVLVALSEDVGDLAGPGTEDPVAREGHEAEERKREDEEFVCERQIPYVVVADRATPDLVVLGDDEDDQAVANHTEHESGQIECYGRRTDYTAVHGVRAWRFRISQIVVINSLGVTIVFSG